MFVCVLVFVSVCLSVFLTDCLSYCLSVCLSAACINGWLAGCSPACLLDCLVCLFYLFVFNVCLFDTTALFVWLLVLPWNVIWHMRFSWNFLTELLPSNYWIPVVQLFSRLWSSKLTSVFRCRLVFTVVSDPPEDEGDCVDVAYASVDFVQVGTFLTHVRLRPNGNCDVCKSSISHFRLARISNGSLKQSLFG